MGWYFTLVKPYVDALNILALLCLVSSFALMTQEVLRAWKKTNARHIKDMARVFAAMDKLRSQRNLYIKYYGRKENCQNTADDQIKQFDEEISMILAADVTITNLPGEHVQST